MWFQVYNEWTVKRSTVPITQGENSEKDISQSKVGEN